ncbi:hypothetical protein SmJEL517_g00765 [Synchytrium microbalum]|uniref:BD-FAE-like domain-containing protein n=1 Tax=Synchytrium microbalum TaxID=1806994 RepID=A0A507CCX0_9FUNG|nr:uncharacterized protein SmJEL517_g00765 [Synchytrium microbalum]TPX37462.1 hypothetical protein SmJEL517_g00765 [Synchytrium microbalum]
MLCISCIAAFNFGVIQIVTIGLIVWAIRPTYPKSFLVRQFEMASGVLVTEGPLVLANMSLFTIAVAGFFGVFQFRLVFTLTDLNASINDFNSLGRFFLGLAAVKLFVYPLLHLNGYASKAEAEAQVKKMYASMSTYRATSDGADDLPVIAPAAPVFVTSATIPVWVPWNVKVNQDSKIGTYPFMIIVDHLTVNIVTYATDEEMRSAGRIGASYLKLDVITPNKGSITHLKPVFVYIHGGAWSVGSKNPTIPGVYHMATKGWVVVNINYRMYPLVNYPTHLIDCKRAMRWVKQNISSYGGDPEFVTVGGGSAGAHLAAVLALSSDRPAYQPGFEDVDLSVKACVAYYMPCDVTSRIDSSGVESTERGFPEWFAKVLCGFRSYEENYEYLKYDHSPIHMLERQATSPKGIPPFFLVHGTLDNLVAVELSQKFKKRCQELGGRCYFLELKGAHHAFDVLQSPRSRYSFWAMEQFLESVYDRRRRRLHVL